MNPGDKVSLMHPVFGQPWAGHVTSIERSPIVGELYVCKTDPASSSSDYQPVCKWRYEQLVSA